MKLACVFPGQGSQSVGMLAELAQNFSQVRATFTEASDILGQDLWTLVDVGPAELLNQTEHTQPALLAASVAMWRIWQAEAGLQPVMLAGHSLGEYSALVCADAMGFADALRCVKLRGQAMQMAVEQGQGAMAAIIGLSDAQVEGLCDQVRQDAVLAAANYNAPGQVVVAGHTAAVSRAMAAAKEQGATLVKALAVSVPSHCSLMQSAAQQMAKAFAELRLQTPAITVVNNVDVQTPTAATAIISALTRQLSQPVRWTASMQYLSEQQVTHVLECGPGKVLTSLGKRIDKNIQWLAMDKPALLTQAVQAVMV